MSSKKDINEEEIQVKNNILNDIVIDDENQDLDISTSFILSKIKTFKKLFSKSTKDLTNNLKKYLNISGVRNVKLFKLKRPIKDIIKKNKKTYILLSEKSKKQKIKYCVNFSDNKYQKKGPFFDIYKIKKPFIILFYNILVDKIKIFLRLKNILILSTFFIFIYSYVFISIKRVNQTIQSVQNFYLNIDSIDNISNNLFNLKKDILYTDLLLKPIYGFNIILQNNNINNLKNGIKGGNMLIDVGVEFINIYDSFFNILQKEEIENIMFTQFISNAQVKINFDIIQKKINSSFNYFNKIKINNNEDLENMLFLFKNKLYHTKNVFDLIYNNLEDIKTIFGNEEKKTYLIVFQNADEIRPLGGFMGSTAIVDIFKGKVINIEKKDIYALEWNLKPFKEKAPEGLHKITPTFGLRDANYYYDVKESSLKINEFLTKSGYNIDGIVYINQNILINFLNEIGNVYFKEIDTYITGDNFSLVMSTLVEGKFYHTHTLGTPKQILFDFMIDFYDKIKELANYNLYINIIGKAVEKKDIIVYLFKEDFNNIFQDIGFYYGLEKEDFLDFNYPVFTSISGNKSDRYIKRTFEKNVNINQDCSINTTININQKHDFNISEELKIKELLYNMDYLDKVDIRETLNIQGKGLNKQFVRLIIPKKANIKENNKINIITFENHKEVRFYIDTNTLFDSNFFIEYTLENSNCDKYNYKLIKQPGIQNYKIKFNLNDNLLIDQDIDKDFIFK